MDILDSMKRRHSVRQYTERVVECELLRRIEEEIAECNRESGLRIQLICDEPRAFSSGLAKYGRFEGVINYIALVGKKSRGLDELAGYYGERLVMLIHELGLQSCWVGLHYKRIPDTFTVERGEKLICLIAFGHGRHRGLPRKSKKAEAVSNLTPQCPLWFERGVEAALLAPTAMNQQRFFIERDGDSVTFKAGIGFYTRVDLGIVRYNFELAAGKDNFKLTSGK